MAQATARDYARSRLDFRKQAGTIGCRRCGRSPVRLSGARFAFSIRETHKVSEGRGELCAQPAGVPKPSTLELFGLGLLGPAGMRVYAR